MTTARANPTNPWLFRLCAILTAFQVFLIAVEGLS